MSGHFTPEEISAHREPVMPTSYRNALTLAVADDLLVVHEREGSCPLCGVCIPSCDHVLWAKAVKQA